MDYGYNLCLDCNTPYESVTIHGERGKWCKKCNFMTLQQNFSNCISGNELIDFIQGKQLDYNFNYIFYAKI